MSHSNPSLFQFPELRVVEASAGSGKTYALAYRYVQLLFHLSLSGTELPLRRILAITFTNKAALEMKARIISVIKKIALGDIAEDAERQILIPFGMDRATAQETARKLMGDIIRQYHFFKVQTIDEFINSILVGCAFKLGLTANFRIRTDSRVYLEYGLEEFIDMASSVPEVMRLFVEFIDHYLFLENRAGWFPKRNILGILADFSSMHNKYAMGFVPAGVTSKDIVSSKSKVLEQMKGLLPLLPSDARLSKTLTKFLANHPKGFDLDALGTTFGNEDIELPKKHVVTAEMETRWAAMRMLLRKVTEDEACGVFDPYLRIFREVHTLLTARTSKDDIVLLDQLNSKARSLFDGSGITVEELYYRLAARYEHYLIDEFQDTSRLQWSNISLMPEEALSHGGTLFYVGDKKQAIYRFRGGDARLFDEVKGQFKAFPVNETWLSRNWRSEAAIVEWNNAIFSPDHLRQFIRRKEADEKERKLRHPVVFSAADMEAALSAFSHARQEPRPGHEKGYVKVEFIDGEKKDDRNTLTKERLLALLGSLAERFSLQDITVLTRKNSEVELVTRWLMEAGYTVNSDRTSDARLHPLIGELCALLSFLVSPVDNLAFARFILGNIFIGTSGYDRAHWEGFILTYRDSLRRNDGVHLYMELRDRFPDVWAACIEKFFKNVGLYPLYELLIGIYRCYGCLERFPAAQGFFMHFLDLVKRQENECPDVRTFLDYFETLEGDDAYVRIMELDAVRVMTVHKAKGLQFPVVILPFFGMEVEPGMQMSMNAANYVCRFKESPGIDGAEQGLALIRLKKKYYDFSPSLYEIYRQEYQEAFIAELNNLYVALTRPQYEMYVFIPQKIGGSSNMARLLVPENICEMGAPAVYPSAPAVTGAQGKATTEVRDIPPPLYRDWVEFISDEFTTPDDLDRRRRQRKGIAMHAILAQIGNVQDANIDALLAKAGQHLRGHIPSEELEIAIAQAARIMRADALRAVFFCGDSEVLTEQDVVDMFGRSRRLDRIIISPEQVTVVDYKSTSPARPEDVAQLRDYLGLCRNIYPGKKVNGCFVFLDTMEMGK